MTISAYLSLQKQKPNETSNEKITHIADRDRIALINVTNISETLFFCYFWSRFFAAVGCWWWLDFLIDVMLDCQFRMKMVMFVAYHSTVRMVPWSVWSIDRSAWLRQTSMRACTKRKIQTKLKYHEKVIKAAQNGHLSCVRRSIHISISMYIYSHQPDEKQRRRRARRTRRERNIWRKKKRYIILALIARK